MLEGILEGLKLLDWDRVCVSLKLLMLLLWYRFRLMLDDCCTKSVYGSVRMLVADALQDSELVSLNHDERHRQLFMLADG